MNDGQAVIHINGAEYLLIGRYTSADSPEFQNLVIRVEGMLGNDGPQQRFDVTIKGESGQLIVQPRGLVSVATVFISEPTVGQLIAQERAR